MCPLVITPCAQLTFLTQFKHMTVLYKYMRHEHAELLLNKGKPRIGTLYEYRDMEKHGGVKGDDSEGKKTLCAEIDNEIWTPETQPGITKGFINLEGPVRFQNMIFENPQESPNHYLFCASEEFDQNTMHTFDCDACVVIENAEKFFATISRVLRKKAKFVGFFPCQYGSRRVQHNHDDGVHPARIKDTSYRTQKEVRALWGLIKNKAHPLLINCRKVSKYCRMLEHL